MYAGGVATGGRAYFGPTVQALEKSRRQKAESRRQPAEGSAMSKGKTQKANGKTARP